MYNKFYSFHEHPFLLEPNPSFFYQSKKHEIALSSLEYALLNQALFSVISGEIGTGKTTLIRYLLSSMGENFTVGLLRNTKYETPEELIQWILLAFDIEYHDSQKVRLYRTLYDFLIKEYYGKRQVVLIVDEAQNLAPDALEELRMISNISVNEHQVLQMIFSGQDSFRTALKCPELKQFAQRVAVSYHLGPLDRKDTHAYILHRLAVASRGLHRKVFTQEACDQIFQYAGGIPRLINILCDMALVYGLAEQKQIIDESLINEVVADKQEQGLYRLAKCDKRTWASLSFNQLAI